MYVRWNRYPSARACSFFPEPGHEAKTRFSLDPVALAPKLGDDLVDGLPTDTCLVADLGSCEIPGAARPYGFEHSGYVVSLTPHHPLSRQGSFALDRIRIAFGRVGGYRSWSCQTLPGTLSPPPFPKPLLHGCALPANISNCIGRRPCQSKEPGAIVHRRASDRHRAGSAGFRARLLYWLGIVNQGARLCSAYSSHRHFTIRARQTGPLARTLAWLAHGRSWCHYSFDALRHPN